MPSYKGFRDLLGTMQLLTTVLSIGPEQNLKSIICCEFYNFYESEFYTDALCILNEPTILGIQFSFRFFNILPYLLLSKCPRFDVDLRN